MQKTREVNVIIVHKLNMLCIGITLNLKLWKGTFYMQGHLIFRKMWYILMTLIMFVPQTLKYTCSKSMESAWSCCLLIFWKLGATEGWNECSVCLSLLYFKKVCTFNPLWGCSNYTCYMLLTLRRHFYPQNIFTIMCFI
jgi:hypothetical protein